MIVGLTGGIGSGKSMVAKLFSILGCPVFNSDHVAKEIYFDKAIRLEIYSLLGQQAYLSENKIDKAYISAKIFNDPQLLSQLNAIIHPAVIERFRLFSEQHAGKLIIKETALLFEINQQKQMDKVITVAANDELRIQRVMARDQLTKEEVTRKISSQVPQEEKIRQSDFVIYNNETDFLITQTLGIFETLNSHL